MTILPPLSSDHIAEDAPFPPALHSLLLASLPSLLAWLSSLLTRALLARCQSHPLLRLHQLYDPAAVVDACAAYRHPSGPGAPPSYSLSILVRAEIVRVWAHSCSDPALECLLATNLLVRWFVGLPLLGPTPDHSTLNRFHAWLSLHQPQALFDDVLAFLDRVDPEDPATTPQIVDTFALQSAAAPTSTALVLRGLCQQLLTLWLCQAPAQLEAVLASLELALLPPKPPSFTPAGYLLHLQQAVAFATAVQTALKPHLSELDPLLRQAVEGLLGLLSKVLEDETTTDEHGQVKERAAKEKGQYRLASALDVEATFRKHDDSLCFGYNAAIATTATRIRAAVVLTGSRPDSEAPVVLLKQEQQTRLKLPPSLTMDQAGGWGKVRAEVETISEGQTMMVAQIPQSGGADLTRFTPADFRVSVDGTRCRCPNGVESEKGYETEGRDGVRFRFTAKQCEGCPLWEKCRSLTSKKGSHRSVYVSWYHEHLRRGSTYNQTEEGKALLRQRWVVEPTIGWLVRYDGCRQARRMGQRAAQCQLFQACAMRNLWRFLVRAAHRGSPAKEAVCA
jgi:hypothetical protein